MNDAPKGIAKAVLVNGSQNAVYNLKTSDLLTGFSDVDNSSLSVTNLTANHGAISATTNGFNLTPQTNYYGAVTLNYSVSDGLLSIPATQTLNLSKVNNPPTGTATAVLTGTEDTAYTFKTTDLLQGFTDADNDTLSVTNLTANNGALNGLVFTPNANYNGAVNISYLVTDGAASISATKTLTLNPVNDAPTGSATAVLVNGTEDTPYTFNSSDLLQGFSDIDGNNLTVTNLTANNGTLNGLVFTPNANYNGVVNLSYSVTDGTASINATRSFNLAKVNDLPTGSPAIIGSNANTAIVGQTMSAGAGTLADADGLGALSYSWAVAGITVSNASTYTSTSNDMGKSLTLTARYTDLQGTAETVTNSAIISKAPNVSLTALDGSTTAENNGIDNSQSLPKAIRIAVQLDAQPYKDVTLNFVSSDTSEGVVTNPSLTFTTSNWNVAQNLIISGVNDNDNDGYQPYQVTATITSDDINYRQLSVNVINLVNNSDGIRDVPQTLSGIDPSPLKTDILAGMDGADKLYGLLGQDDLSGGIGDDSLYGGYDNDILYGGDGNDYLSGETDNDILNGENGTDSLDGGAGFDTLNGGEGNDSLDGGTGIDYLSGGKGNDTYYLGYDGVDTIVDNGLNSDIDTVIMPYVLFSYTLPTGIENASITAGALGDLTGNDSDNSLTGNDGVNNLSGMLGRDSLFAGASNDTLNGGLGNDTLKGGTGQDIFKFDTAISNVSVKINIDVIQDFAVVDDTLQLSHLIFTKFTKFNAQIPAGTLKIGTSAGDANDYLIYNQTTGALTYDADGSGAGAGIQIATLGVNLPLTTADFVII